MNFNETLMWKEINETSRIFEEIMPKNKTIMEALVKSVETAKVRNIICVGRGTSDHALIFFKYAAEILSKYTVGLGACSVSTLYDSNIDYSGNLVIGVSQSGKAADVLEVLKKAKSQGAITLAVTNHEDSPMAMEASYHLFCNAGLEKSVAATKTFSAQLYLLFYLAASLAKNSDKINMLTDLSKDVDNSFAKITEQADKFVDQFKNTKSGFILARGVTFAIALEATLKLQETSYIQMRGYAASDFYHGPMAMVNSETPVIIYAPRAGFVTSEREEVIFSDFCKCIDKMESLGATVLVVTDNKEYSSKYTNVALLPENCCEFKTMFMFALFAQIFACKVSCGIGNNPDSPRALNKVTITK